MHESCAIDISEVSIHLLSIPLCKVYLQEVRLRAGMLKIASQYITASTIQLHQFIGQCRSRHTLRLIIEETNGV
jgi:hypothetical protein